MTHGSKEKEENKFSLLPLEHDGCPRLGHPGLNTCSGCSGQRIFSQ